MLNEPAVPQSWPRLIRPSAPPRGDTRPHPAALPRGHAQRRPGLRRRKRLNLALQGGGAHGAFTWGVIDALLEHTDVDFDGVSGTSAGAVNAVALAAGLMEHGRDGARETLYNIWSAISRAGAPVLHPASPLAYFSAPSIADTFVRLGLNHLSSAWSPYDLNPLNINPLRDILTDHIDFDKLRRLSPVKLFIAATEVSSGAAKIFRTEEISVDAVLASACLPKLFQAIEIDGESYWDGGFSANPDLISLISETRVDDTLLTQIIPDRDPDLPVSSEAIAANIARLSFNQPLRSQVERIEHHRQTPIRFGLAARRLAKHRMHLIDGSPHTLKLNAATKSHPDWRMITKLREQGYAMATSWSDDYFGSVGKKATVDLYAKYFADKPSVDEGADM